VGSRTSLKDSKNRDVLLLSALELLTIQPVGILTTLFRLRPIKIKSKGTHTRTSLASESGWARVQMSKTRPCVECHVPDLADSGLARQGLRWGSARRRLATGSYVCGRSQARLAYPHGHKHC
jgi:hypothetical protein